VLSGVAGAALGAVVTGALLWFGSEIFAPEVIAARHDLVPSPEAAPAVGDCLSLDPFEADVTSRDDLVPCETEHGSEVIGVVAMPDVARPPGGDDLEFFVDDACRLAFADYIGENFDDSGLLFWAVPPSDQAWQAGDRQLYCLLDSIDHNDGRGSARGSAA
jgi:Septum formation